MEFLSHHNVAYVDKDICKDPQALQELIALGSSATPTTVIDGKVIVGFDRRRISELLGI